MGFSFAKSQCGPKGCRMHFPCRSSVTQKEIGVVCPAASSVRGVLSCVVTWVLFYFLIILAVWRFINTEMPVVSPGWWGLHAILPFTELLGMEYRMIVSFYCDFINILYGMRFSLGSSGAFTLGPEALVYLIMHWCKMELYHYYANILTFLIRFRRSCIFHVECPILVIAQVTACNCAHVCRSMDS